MSGEEMIEEVNYWADDLLDRKRYADFLTQYIDTKVQAEKPGMVMALDATWGLGKTFFISRWAEQLRASKHGVVVFDAWQNDSSEDPVIAFMASLRAGLNPIVDKLPMDKAIAAELKETTAKLPGKLRRATISTAKVFGAGLLKKTTGVAFDDLLGAFNAEEADPQVEQEAQQAAADPADSVANKALIEKGLDDFFEKTLQGHTDRMRAVADFRSSLQDLLQSLRAEGVMQGPLYVFIDELDRCRPNYAIDLLEGVKHLFSVQGVAFVVSTNLDQLSKAMGAVYGASFDGFLYLKRFFDFEYELPQPTRINFIRSQLTDTATEKIKDYSGLDTRLRGKPTDVANGFAAVSEAMRLDLRSLNRILMSVEAVIANLPEEKPIVCLWLFFLTALKYKHHTEFQSIASHSLNVDEFKSMCNKIFTGTKTVLGCKYEKREGGALNRIEAPYQLSDALCTYYRATLEDANWIIRAFERGDPHADPYPGFLLTTLFDRTQDVKRDRPHPIDGYANLISMAGHVV